jgi:hypothetical protein
MGTGSKPVPADMLSKQLKIRGRFKQCVKCNAKAEVLGIQQLDNSTDVYLHCSCGAYSRVNFGYFPNHLGTVQEKCIRVELTKEDLDRFLNRSNEIALQ